MAFKWQIPYQPPDPAALERMRRHFGIPSELMPEAWFLSGTTYIEGYDDVPPETIDADSIGYLFREIWTGIAFFPGVSPDRWKAWFRYLLPYALVLVNTRQDDSRLDRLQEGIFRAFCHIYPQQIIEEYPGFRDDVVYTLGSRIIPDLLSRDDPAPMSASLQNPVFNDIWDFTNSPSKETPGLYEEFDLPMQFCLHYLNEAEMETWVNLR